MEELPCACVSYESVEGGREEGGSRRGGTYMWSFLVQSERKFISASSSVTRPALLSVGSSKHFPLNESSP